MIKNYHDTAEKYVFPAQSAIGVRTLNDERLKRQLGRSVVVNMPPVPEHQL